MKRKILKAAGVFGLSVILCTGMVGCSGKRNDQPNTPDVQTVKENDNSAEGNQDDTGNNGTESGNEIPDDSREEGIFYDGANLSGRVVDFSDTGFIITPRTMIINEDGSIDVGAAAPGYESEETNITVTYAEDVVFQIINFSMSSQAEISREDTDKSSIKKETEVDIFGTCQDEKHWTADKVVITRWQ